MTTSGLLQSASLTLQETQSIHDSMNSRGGTLIFSHTRRLGLFFGVKNSEFQYFLGFSEK